METLSWLRRNWLGSLLCAFYVIRIMINQGLPIINFALLGLIIYMFTLPKRQQGILWLIALLSISTVGYQAYVAPRIFLSAVRMAVPPQIDSVYDSVFLGGERLLVSPMEDNSLKRYSSIAGFHTQDGITLATAHGVGYDEGRVLVRLADSSQAQTEYATVACNDFGVVFPTLRTPSGALVPIANVDEIEMGRAEVHQLGRAPIGVEVVGYYHTGSISFLVLWGDEPCRQGYSGSPVVQDGKLIGLVYGYMKMSNRIWLARISADLYHQVYAVPLESR